MSSSQRSNSNERTERARICCIAALAALAFGCSADDEWITHERYAMGTAVVTIHRRIDAADERALQAAIDRQLELDGSDYYAWGDGELGRLNAALAAGQPFEVSPPMAQLLERARTLSERSGGNFDPGVGAMVEAWGFHSADSTPAPPPEEFLATWAANPTGIADLEIRGNRISAGRAIAIDLGGIAKGEIVDRLIDRFAQAGVEDALIDAGGDVRVLGSRGERAWTIGIQSPRAAADLLGSIELHDGEAAFTSGDYERFFDAAGTRSHHLLDPRTGRPATHTQAVTVIAGNGALADAAATAIFVAGPGQWQAVAMALGITQVLRVDADGTTQMTPAMRERVRMHAAREPATMTAQP